MLPTLFPLEPLTPEGFLYEPGFITTDEEQALLNAIEGLSLQAFVFEGYEAKRRVASFGYDYSFEKGKLVKGQEIPAAFQPLVLKVAERLGVRPEAFAELLVTEYPPGSVINWHRDAPPFDWIAGISLLSDCTFKLRPFDEARRSRKMMHTLQVQRRSLYLMRDAVRWEWQHSITALPALRYSITLRTLK